MLSGVLFNLWISFALIGTLWYIEVKALPNGRRLATPRLKGGGAYGYIRSAICVLFADRQHCKSDHSDIQKERTAP